MVVFDFDELKSKGSILENLLGVLKIENRSTYTLPYINSSLSYDRYLIQTHIFRVCTDEVNITKCLKNLSDIKNTPPSKICLEDEVVVNRGLLVLMDLFYDYLSQSTVIDEKKRMIMGEVLEYLASENEPLYLRFKGVFDDI